MDQEKTSKAPQFIITILANLASMSCGMMIAWPSPAATKLTNIDDNPFAKIMSNEEISWIGSIICLGGIFGPIFTGFLIDKLGRRITLVIASMPGTLSWFMIATTSEPLQLYAGRFFMGVGMGAIFTSMSIYVGEIAEDAIRGALLSFFQLFLTIGFTMAYSIGPYVSWACLAWICLGESVLFAVLFCGFCPESPYHLAATAEKEEAARSLKRLRGRDAGQELDIIQRNVDEAKKNKGFFMDLLKVRSNRKALITVMGLIIFQQLSGVNAVLFNAQTIFAATGSSMSPEISTIIIGVVQVLASAVTPFVVDRLGRRFLLLLSSGAMALSLVGISVFFTLKDGFNHEITTALGYLPLISLIVYICLFCIGFGPIPWAIMGELFSPEVKSTGCMIVASTCWLVAFVITKFFSNVTEAIGLYSGFWICSALCGFAFVFVFFLLLETKGKSLAEIQELLADEKWRTY